MTYAIIERERAPGILDGRSAVAPSVLASKRADPDFVHVLAGERRTLGTRDFLFDRNPLRKLMTTLQGNEPLTTAAAPKRNASANRRKRCAP